MTLRNVLPGWSIRLLVLCLLLPALLAALDSFFRARRRRLPDRRLARLDARRRRRRAARVGVAARARDRRRAPGSARPGRSRRPAAGRRARRRRWRPSRSSSRARCCSLRPLTRAARASRGSPAAGAAGAAAGAIVCAVTLAVWLVNPYAAALLLPAAHLWLFLGVPQTRLRGRIAWIALAAGLLAPLLVLVYELRALRAGPLELARMWLVATAGGHVSVLVRARARRAGGLLRHARPDPAGAPPDRRGGAARAAAHARAGGLRGARARSAGPSRR